ncbi:MAG: SPW repeat domain-containing protein [Bacteroidia bacterium]
MDLIFKNLFFVGRNDFAEDKRMVYEVHHRQISWVYFAIMVIGLWLIVTPFTFGYTGDALIYNDILLGIAIIILSYLSLKPYNLWAQWIIVFIGLWFFVVPIIFWAAQPVIYLNQTLIAILLTTLGIIIPDQPGIKLFEQEGNNVPPGWSYNPSSWSERIPVITFAWIGFFVAQYMGAYQLGYIEEVWDPVFGEGTSKVLTSDISKAFPVPDASLGAFAYIMDVLMGYVGGTHRWRTMPWVVIIFGILIIPLGVVSITLIILQPIAVGYWCSLCLVSAVISLAMIPFTIDEVLATIQLIKYEKKNGKPFWRTFWFGGTMPGGSMEETYDPEIILQNTGKSLITDFINKPWNLFLSFALGIYIIASPAVFNYSDALAYSHFISGALIATFAVIAMSEVARTLRFINILFGIWIITSPWILGYDNDVTLINSVIAGIILIILTFPKGKVEDERGRIDKYIF